MKLKIYPDLPLPNGGIATVLEDHKILLAQHQFVQKESEADLILTHVSARSQTETDITFTHGLYPTADRRWHERFNQVNQMIFQNIANSLQVVSVSHWGGRLIKRYSGIQPHIIHNGIFYNEYVRAGRKKGPVLWGKTSINPVCDPSDFAWLASQTLQPFVSFVDLPNVKKISPLTREGMKRYLQECSILVATTKENDSFLIMEAMASGVPVLAYDWGMAKERLQHKKGCYLVPPHDHMELLKGYNYLCANWQLQSEIAHTVAGWFDWEIQKTKLLALLQQTLQQKQTKPSVSIIIPCHNYGKYVKQAIQSAQQQTIPCEVIVVDDGSTDDSLTIIQEQNPDKVIVHPTAQGVAKSRNEAISQAKGTHIICLDADDHIHPNYAATLLKGFTSRDIAACYTPLQVIDGEGKPTTYLMFNHLPNIMQHKNNHNQIPCHAMFAKSWWQRVDGYDHFIPMAEDANLWLKIFLLKGKAKQVTRQPMVYYRRHGKNASLQPMPAWNIFHEHKVIDEQNQLVLILVGEGLETYHAYWRLKELNYPIQIFTEVCHLPKNYLVLSPSPDILTQVKERLNTWTQLFSFQPA